MSVQATSSIFAASFTGHLAGSHGKAGKEAGHDRTIGKLRDSCQSADAYISMILLDPGRFTAET
jgi:hypothetical protein